MTLRLPNDHRIKLYTRTNATKLGQGIFICVQLAKKERYKALRFVYCNTKYDVVIWKFLVILLSILNMKIGSHKLYISTLFRAR